VNLLAFFIHGGVYFGTYIAPLQRDETVATIQVKQKLSTTM